MTALAEMERAIRTLHEATVAETAALHARDLIAAAALAEPKAHALAAFQTARVQLPPEVMAMAAGRLGDLLDRLRRAVEENRAALEMGIALQSRVIETLARIAAQPAIASPGYGPNPAPQQGAAPLALSLRA